MLKWESSKSEWGWSCTKEVRFLRAWICGLRFILADQIPPMAPHCPWTSNLPAILKSSVVWFLFPTSLMSHHLQQSAHLPATAKLLYVPEVPAMVPHFCVCSVSFLCLQCPYTMRPPWEFYHLLKISTNMRPTNDPGWIRAPPLLMQFALHCSK